MKTYQSLINLKMYFIDDESVCRASDSDSDRNDSDIDSEKSWTSDMKKTPSNNETNSYESSFDESNDSYESSFIDDNSIVKISSDDEDEEAIENAIENAHHPRETIMLSKNIVRKKLQSDTVCYNVSNRNIN